MTDCLRTLDIAEHPQLRRLGSAAELSQRARQGCPICQSIAKSVQESGIIYDEIECRFEPGTFQFTAQPTLLQFDLFECGSYACDFDYGEGKSAQQRSALAPMGHLRPDMALSIGESRAPDPFSDASAPFKLGSDTGPRRVRTASEAKHRWQRLNKDVPATTNDPATLRSIKKWVSVCTGQHSSCRRFQAPQLPTRVIDVGIEGEEPFLCEPRGQRAPYVTLSHRWGNPQPLRTLLGNLESHKKKIALSALPKTFADAITLLRYLQVQYLWIDSLCIIQDSQHDWAIEAGKMASIYSKALFTISASANQSSEDGLFHPVSAPFHGTCRSPKLPGLPSQLVGVRPSLPSFNEEFITSSLSSRGWIYQERALSRAILHFGSHQVFWECKDSIMSQTVPLARPEDTTAMRQLNDYLNALRTEARRHDSIQQEQHASPPELDKMYRKEDKHAGLVRLRHSNTWIKVVEDYSALQLTKPTDRYAAILGIVSDIRDVCGSSFLAGIWLEQLHVELAWAPKSSFDWKSQFAVSASRFPSWSWMSVDYEIQYRWFDTPLRDFRPDVWLATSRRCIQPENIVYDGNYTSRFALHLRGIIIQPTDIKPHGLEKSVLMHIRGQDSTVQLGGYFDPAFSTTRQSYLLRLCHNSSNTAVYLLLERVGEVTNGAKQTDLGTFRRVGIGSTTLEKITTVFEKGNKGTLILV